MEEKEITPEKSLEIISHILQQNRKEFERNAGTPMIIWGSLVIVFALGIWYLWTSTQDARWNVLWFILPIMGYAWAWRNSRKKKRKATNILNRAVSSIWIVFGIISVGTALLFPLTGMAGNINQTIIPMMGLCTAITGMIIRSWGISLAGIITALGGSIAVNLTQGPEFHLILGGAAFISLLLPGIVMNLSTSKKE